MVHRGDVLLVVDPARFDLALRQAEAAVAIRLATLQQTVRDLNRAQGADQRGDQPPAGRTGAGDRGRCCRRIPAGDRRSRPGETEPGPHPAHRTGQRHHHQFRPAARRLRDRRPPGNGAGRHRLAAHRCLFRGNQAAAHPPRRPGQHPPDGRGAATVRTYHEYRRRDRGPGAAAWARTCWRTSTRPSVGCAWRSASRCGSLWTMCRPGVRVIPGRTATVAVVEANR